MNQTSSIMVEANSFELMQQAAIDAPQSDEFHLFAAISIAAFFISIAILSFAASFIVKLIKRKTENQPNVYWYQKVEHKPFKND